MSPAAEIALWGLGFIASHVLLSHPGIRDAFVRRLGLRPFQALYSAIAFVFFVPYVRVWWANRHAGALWWHLRDNPAIVTASEAVIVVGFALLMGGAVHPVPTSIAFGGRRPKLRGMMAITRAPVLMGAVFIAVGHLVVNGWAADVAFWSVLLGIGLIGGWHQDWRKARQDPAYAALREHTTVFPIPRPSALRTIGPLAAGGMIAGAAIALVLRAYHARLFAG